jgi:hypothetical protein
MGRRPLPPGVLELRGAFLRHPERRPPIEPSETSEVATLAEQRLTVAEPCPPSIQDARGVRLWEQLVATLLERQLLSRDLLRPLERYVLLNFSLWRAAELGKTVTAALSAQLTALEIRLGLAKESSTKPSAARPALAVGVANKWAELKRWGEELDAEWARDSKAWQARCRREAGEALALARRLRFDRRERRRLLGIKDKP